MNVSHANEFADGYSYVYWQPVFNVLEGLFEVLVVDAQHVKAVPRRQTDIKDAEWSADLLQHGLLRTSLSRRPPSVSCGT